MPDETIPTAPPGSPTPQQQPQTSFNIGEEFGTAKKNLPSLKIVLISVAVIAIIAAIVSLVQKPRQKATGAIGDVSTADVPGQNLLMVGIALSIQNPGEKPLLPRDVSAEVATDSGSFTDQAASLVDVPRYLQAFPALAVDNLAPLQLENAIPPGGHAQGLIIVSFPVTADVFTKRKSLKITITDPNQAVPLVLTK
jgi:hypothetical protein